MDIQEYADAINVEIHLKRYENQDNRWMAEFPDCELMEDGCLASAYGNGKTPDEAIRDYVNQIAGKRIAIGAYTDGRREFNVPASLCHTTAAR